MNYKQGIVIAIATIVIGVSFLFPPWITLKFPETDQGRLLLTHSERRLFNNPPKTSDVKAPYIAWRYPVQDGIVATIVAGALCFFLRTRKTREDAAMNDCSTPTAAF